jgi:methionyl-tRNA formyltransferase
MDSLILLCSGNLGAIALDHIHRRNNLRFVFTDNASSSIVQYCSENNIPFYAGNPRNGGAKKIIASLNCSVILSVNYLFVIEADLLAVACHYAINFHGSLLPKYRGRTPHVWAIINGEKETGITAHLMTGDVDTGPIVRQIVISIEDTDTGYSILNKFNKIYPLLIDDVLSDIEQKKVSLKEQDHAKATYFGKRTAEDGTINWNWQKERIRNWVRAQAAPYPGAFSFYKNEKLIIHEVDFDDFGFRYDDPNGLILHAENRPIIKTPNGAIRLIQFESASKMDLERGKILCERS